MQTHETVSSFRKVAIGSNTKFGVTFGVLFGILGFWPLFHHNSPKWWLVAMSAGVLAAALLFPRCLTLPNRAWFQLGLALNKIVSPIVMGGLFFGAVVPVGWYVRKTGKDLLHLKLDSEAATYWIERNPPGPAHGTLTKQF
jgi:Saxitoxin biosynthesis operon protein SxtJ